MEGEANRVERKRERDAIVNVVMTNRSTVAVLQGSSVVMVVDVLCSFVIEEEKYRIESESESDGMGSVG